MAGAYPRHRMRGLRALILVGAVSVGTTAWAQTTPNATAAQALFDEGKASMKAGRYDEACPKLEESQRLDPGGGTLVALGLCYEAQGRTASAWSEWNLALSSARSERRADREKLALDHIHDLEPRLARLRLTVTSAVTGTELRRDGVVVDPALWGTALPVDPGEHRFEARAPGKKPWQGVVVVRPEPSTVDFTVPRLEDEPAAPPPVVRPPAPAPAPPAAPVTPGPPPAASTAPRAQPPPPPEASSPSTARQLSYVAGGAGVVSLVLGTVFAASASSKWNDARHQCPDDRCTSPGAVSEGTDAGNAADLSTDFFVVGGVLAATAVVMFLVSGGHPAPATGTIRVTPMVGAVDGLMVGGAL